MTNYLSLVNEYTKDHISLKCGERCKDMNILRLCIQRMRLPFSNVFVVWMVSKQFWSKPVDISYKPDMTHITSCRNDISIESTASAVFVVFWLVLPLRKEEFYTVQLKTYNCIVFTNFQHKKLYSFHNLSLGFSLKIFLKFRKFQLRYSYKKCICYLPAGRSVW